MNRAFVLGLVLLVSVGILRCPAVSFAADADPWQQKISISFKDTPLLEALGTIVGDIKVSSFDFPSSALGRKVTAVFKDVSREKALNEIVTAAGVTIKRDGDSISIEDNAPQGYGGETTRPQAGYSVLPSDISYHRAAAEARLAQARAKYELAQKTLAGYEQQFKASGLGSKEVEEARALVESARIDVQATEDALITTVTMSLNYLQPSEVIPLVLAQGVHAAFSVSGDKLAMVGPKKTVDAAANLVRSLDQPTAIPKSMDVTVQAKLTVTTGDEPAKDLEMSVTSSGPSGETIRLTNKVSGKPEEGRLEMDISIIPGSLVGEEIVVSVDGKLEYFAMGANAKEPSSAVFKSTPRVVPGKPVSLCGGSFKWEDTETRYEIWLTIAPSEEKPDKPAGRVK